MDRACTRAICGFWAINGGLEVLCLGCLSFHPIKAVAVILVGLHRVLRRLLSERECRHRGSRDLVPVGRFVLGVIRWVGVKAAYSSSVTAIAREETSQEASVEFGCVSVI